MICDECGLKDAEEGSDVCFRCRVASVGFGFRGGGFLYGRGNFAERTNQEFINEHLGEVKDNPRYAHMGSQEWQG